MADSKKYFPIKRLLAVIVKHTIENFKNCSYDVLDSNTLNKSRKGVDSMTAALRELKQEREEGREEGVILSHFNSLLRKIQKGKSYEIIVNEIDEIGIDDEYYFEELWATIQDYPEYSAEKLLDVYLEK